MKSVLQSLRTPRALSVAHLVAAVAIVIATAPELLAQHGGPTGRIVGRVLDSQSGSPVPGAFVEVVGTGLHATSSVDGRYTLLSVPAGSTTLRVRIIGYQAKAVAGIAVPDGGVVGQDVTLSPAQAIELEGVTVEATVERGSVVGVLEEQRQSSNIINAVTAEQIERSPDRDAGQAVKRVSGVTIHDDKYVFVRGLGERYTTTALNGARVPSPEPDKKVVPFDLFPANLIETITTSKTFTPEQAGDFSGAHVNIRTREFPLGRMTRFGMSMGYNSRATGQDVARAPTVGTEWMGLAGSERAAPPQLVASGNLQGLSQGDVNGLIASFRNAWSAPLDRGAPNGSFSVALGGEDPVLGMPLGYVASLTYSVSQEIRADEQRALAVAEADGSTRVQNEYRGSTGQNGVLWGGLLNLTGRLGGANKITLNNTFTLSGDNQAIRLGGLNEEFGELFDITRLTFTERRVRSHRLTGEHLLGRRHTLEWDASASSVRRYEPDRSDLVYIAESNDSNGQLVPVMWWGGPRSAVRTYSDLHESQYQAGGSYTLSLGSGIGGPHIKIGGSYRSVDRTDDSRSYDIINSTLDEAQRSAPAERLFDGQYAREGAYFLLANASGGIYTAADRVTAGYVQLDAPLGAKLQIVGGARIEDADLRVDATASNGKIVPAQLRNTDVLPSVAVNYRFSDAHVLRLSASRTLARPEYRELAEVQYYDIVGGRTLIGNSGLRRSLIQNYDVRWEWYPHAGEVLSLGVFHKRFDDPIERIIVGTTGASTLSFVNADAATNSGVELEVRKALVTMTPALAPFTVFANMTLMNSDIRTGSDSVSSLTNDNRPMVGQSEYVVNAGLGYSSASGRLNATLLYNVAGRRIVEAGQLPLPDTYEEARHLIDLSVEVPVAGSMSARINAKNLLDSPVHWTQGSVTRLRYYTGRELSVGLSWIP